MPRRRRRTVIAYPTSGGRRVIRDAPPHYKARYAGVGSGRPLRDRKGPKKSTRRDA